MNTTRTLGWRSRIRQDVDAARVRRTTRSAAPVLSAALFPVVLAGCANPGPSPEGGLEFTAAWQPWHDDPFPHLIVDLANRGYTTVSVGPGGALLSVTGPSGSVPVDWGSNPFARPVLADQEVVVAFHPRMNDAGRFTLTIDHADGIPANPPTGDYTVCVGTTCEPAPLGG